jgi:hypothetical protein
VSESSPPLTTASGALVGIVGAGRVPGHTHRHGAGIDLVVDQSFADLRLHCTARARLNE